MSKYDPLKQFLVDSGADSITKNFDEIADIVGIELPASAFKHRAWWSNNKTNSVITQAWLEAGYVTRNVNMDQCTLEFHKRSMNRRLPEDRSKMNFHNQELPREDQQGDLLSRVMGILEGTVTVDPDTDLTDPIDEQWNALK